jgi:hypothetical protein
MRKTRRRKRRRELPHSKTALRLGMGLSSPPRRGSQRKARICEVHPAVPDGLDEILFNVSNENLFFERKKPS